MTTLTELINDVLEGYARSEDPDNATLAAESRLRDYILAHAADIAERERLEREVVELHKALLVAQEQQRAAGAFDSLLVTLYAGQLSEAKDALIDYVIAHANDGAAT